MLSGLDKDMQTFEYWEVTESFDKYATHIANFATEEEAKRVGTGVYRSVQKRVFVLFDSKEEFVDNEREKVRARALAKLTAQERQALGFE